MADILMLLPPLKLFRDQEVVLLRHCASQFLEFGLSTETVLQDLEAITFALLRFVAGTPATTSGATSGSLDNQDHCMNGSPFYAMFGYFDIFWPCSR